MTRPVAINVRLPLRTQANPRTREAPPYRADKARIQPPRKTGGHVNEGQSGKLKLLIRPVRGFKTMKTAYATIKGFEVMRALRKGQASIFAIQGGIVGEARIVERAFGVGPCVLTEDRGHGIATGPSAQRTNMTQAQWSS